MVAALPSLTATWHNDTYPAINPTQPHLSLKEKAVLITGGGRGIGAQTARSVAAAGASFISITGRTLSTLTSAVVALESEFPATKILTAVGDVTDEAAMDSAFSALSAANSGNGVDICIHNAGYLPDVAPIAEADTPRTRTIIFRIIWTPMNRGDTAHTYICASSQQIRRTLAITTCHEQ